MGVEILAKARDAASMFWQSLDDHERRALVFGCIYLGYLTCALFSASQEERERDRLKREIVEELRG